MLLYAAVIFLAAFLLFQIQPLIAKVILPWFGGSSAVWTTCMLFFQVMLPLGYLYAHWLHRRRGTRRQALVHSVLLGASLAVLPVSPARSWTGAAGASPVWPILGLLAASVGLPYLGLATTSPLLQAWYSRAHAGAVPYRLFALSNFASLLALLSYPVLVEPNLSTALQAKLWSAGYALFAIGSALVAWRSAAAPDPKPEASGRDAGASGSLGCLVRWLWLALPATACVLLLAFTAYITQDVAAVPFLWILPLSAYLLSFILCFETSRVYQRKWFFPLLAVALVEGYMLSVHRGRYSLVPTVSLAVGCLFVFSMVCHGELVRLKPHPRHLTAFYLMLSAGGALGGILVGFIAPTVFDAGYELEIGLASCALLAAGLVSAQHRAFFQRSWGRLCAAGLLAALAAYIAVLGFAVRKNVQGYRVVTRNFYGQLRVREVDEDDGAGPRRKMLHGTINHGEQILNVRYRNQPGSYYCPGTGVSRAMRAGPTGIPRRIGILGLGCGALAVYGRAGDTLRIYEINPAVLRLARSEFTYLRDTPARVEVVLGDARLSLEREPDQCFNVLVMDAFSGDSVPVHLLTKEAFRTYFRHLAPDGILAVNISNRYLDLRPVVERAARYFGKLAVDLQFEADEEDVQCFSADWVLIGDPALRQARPSLLEGPVLAPHDKFRLWTDDYSSLGRILK